MHLFYECYTNQCALPVFIKSRGMNLTSDSSQTVFPSYQDVCLLFGSEDREDLFELITKSIISLPDMSTPIELPTTMSNQATEQEVTHLVP